MPRSTIGVDLRISRRCQRGMCGSPVLYSGGPVGGRTHQRMPEAYVRTDVQQAGLRGEVHGRDVQTEYLSGPQNQHRVPDRVGSRQKDQLLNLERT